MDTIKLKKSKRMFIVLNMILFISCSDSSLSNNSESPSLFVEKKQLDTGNLNNQIGVLWPGIYNETSIAIDSKKQVTGYYKYLDAWDDKLKEYTQICLFYFKGQYLNDSIISIKTGWPTTKQKLEGHVKIQPKGLSITLNDIPFGYAAEDFTEEDAYFRELKEKKNWIQIRIVKSPKARLFSEPDSSKLLKPYIVKNDVVKVLSINGEWYKIEYSPLGSDKKTVVAWLRDSDFYDIDPSKW